MQRRDEATKMRAGGLWQRKRPARGLVGRWGFCERGVGLVVLGDGG
jgi:hypothetical protein